MWANYINLYHDLIIAPHFNWRDPHFVMVGSAYISVDQSMSLRMLLLPRVREVEEWHCNV